MKRILITLCFFLMICQQLCSQSWMDTSILIQSIFARYAPANPGYQLAINRNGKNIYSVAWGMADLEHRVALTTESLIEAGSVSKQFTAACILLLEQEGKLSLNDDVHKYIPELPDYGVPITLRHMMQHTSGIKDWGSIADIAGWPRSTKTYSNDDALYIICRQKTLNFKPGDEYLYSNSNYNLFAIIIQRVSGKSLAEYSKLKIFEPAGMKHTEWRNDFRKIVPDRAMAYEKSGNNYLTDMPNEYVYGNGGLLTTAEDLVQWNLWYNSGRLGGPQLLERQLTTNPFNNGKPGRYAAGLRIDSTRGWKRITHDGATAGYRASLTYIPDAGLSIAWLSNTSEFDAGADPVESLRALFLVNKNPQEPPLKPVEFTISEEKLKSYTGWYSDARNGNGIQLLIRDSKLAESRSGYLTPIAENTFSFRGSKVEMLPGKTKQLRLTNSGDTILWQAAEPAISDPGMLSKYTGDYYSEEAETTFSILLKDGKLVAHRNPKSDFILTATHKDAFLFPGGVLVFDRDKKNNIKGFNINVGRARNVSFTLNVQR